MLHFTLLSRVCHLLTGVEGNMRYFKPKKKTYALDHQHEGNIYLEGLAKRILSVSVENDHAKNFVCAARIWICYKFSPQFLKSGRFEIDNTCVYIYHQCRFHSRMAAYMSFSNCYVKLVIVIQHLIERPNIRLPFNI